MRLRQLGVTLVLGLVALLVSAVAPVAASAASNPSTAKDYAIIARDIIPSGQYGAVPSAAGSPMLAKEEQQAEMYNALTPLFNHVTTADVFADFKPEPVGVAVTGPLTPDPDRPTHPGRDDPARRSTTCRTSTASRVTTSPGAPAGSRPRTAICC